MKPKRAIVLPKGARRVPRPASLSPSQLLLIKQRDAERRRKIAAEARVERQRRKTRQGLKASNSPRAIANRPSKKRRKAKSKTRRLSGHLRKRAGGVMTPGSQLIIGRRTIITASGSTVNTVVQSVLAYQKILDQVVSNSGNHKTPTRHQFRTRRIDYGSGKTTAFVSGHPDMYTEISGNAVIGYGLSATTHDGQTLVYNKTLSRLYDKLRGDVDLSVDLFEARQTKQMMSTRFKQGREVFFKKVPFAFQAIGGIISAMRRSNPRDWGSLWLEFTYGWKPLAGSIFGAAEQMILAAGPGSAGGVRGMPVRASASEKTDSFIRTQVTGTPGVYNTLQVNSLYQAKVVAFYAMTTGGLNAVANYTSLNPVSIAWELVPYSFVVDWFVNVGGYLRNMESSLLYGSDFVGGVSYERSKISIEESSAGGNNSYTEGGKGNSQTRTFLRTPMGGSPSPRRPGFSPHLGTSRLISAASLLGQQLHSLKHVKESYDRNLRSKKGKPPFDWNSIIHS